jgi:hypothetical protein
VSCNHIRVVFRLIFLDQKAFYNAFYYYLIFLWYMFLNFYQLENDLYLWQYFVFVVFLCYLASFVTLCHFINLVDFCLAKFLDVYCSEKCLYHRLNLRWQLIHLSFPSCSYLDLFGVCSYGFFLDVRRYHRRIIGQNLNLICVVCMVVLYHFTERSAK